MLKRMLAGICMLASLSELLRSKPTEPVAPVRFRYSTNVSG
jgi:hypothetical protein